jgi:cation diffusion facilitator family transporter
MTRDFSAIQRILIITLLLNLGATGVKLTIGFWTGALSLVADGLDNLFDGIGNVVGIIAVRMSSRPPDEEHPYGHRKYETLAALLIAGVFFITAWELGRDAVQRLMEPPPLDVNWWTIGALVVGSALQAIAGLWERRKAIELDSEVLMADARHTLASIAVSGAVLVGLALVWLGYTWADPAVALLVAIVIAKIGVDTIRENIPALVDRAPLDAEKIGRIVASVQGVESYHRIRSRGPADSVAIDLHVRVAPQLSMQDANAIADEVRRRLLAMPGVDDVTVHAEAQRDAESALELQSAVKLAAQELGVVVHESWVQEMDDGLSLHLHVGVDPNLTLREAHAIVDRLETVLRERLPELSSVLSHIELANVEILPSARVSQRLQQRVRTAVENATAEIAQLSSPHNIQVRQVEG